MVLHGGTELYDQMRWIRSLGMTGTLRQRRGWDGS